MIINKETQQYREASGIVSLGKLFTTLDLTPTNLQLSLIDMFDTKLMSWSELNLTASRRSGKTFTVSVITVLELLKPHSSVILVSRSSKSLTANFNEILKNLRLLGVKPDKLNSNTYSLSIGNSHLRCSVYKQTENLLGARASLIILDECGVYTYSDFMSQVLEPMRIDYGSYEETNQFVSKIVKVSSPRTIGSDYHMDYEKGLPPLMERHKYDKNSGYINNGRVSFNYNIYDSPLVASTMIDAIKKNTTADVWRTEYLCEFIHASAVNVFPQFNKERHLYILEDFLDKIHTVHPNGTFKGFMGIDIGLIDSTAIIVGTIIENRLYVLEALSFNLATTEEIAMNIQRLQHKWRTHDKLKLDFEDGAVYIDPSAALTRFDLVNQYDTANLPAFNKIKIGIDSMNSLFRDNMVHIPVEEDNLILQLDTLAWKESATYSLNAETSGDPFLRVKGHHHDEAHAFRYLVASLKRYWNLPEQSTIDYSKEWE